MTCQTDSCLVEVLEEREGAIACQEIHQVTRNGVHSVKDASAAKNGMWLHLRPQHPRSTTNPCPEHRNAQSAGKRRVSALCERPLLLKQLRPQVPAVRDPVGVEKRRKRRGGCSSIGYHRARGAGSVGRRRGHRKACGGPAQSSAHIAAAYADRPQSQCCLAIQWRKAYILWGRWRPTLAFWSPICSAGRL